MKTKQELSITALRWVLAIVLGGEALVLLLSEQAINAYTRTGLPNFVRLAVAGSEGIAASLFLITPTVTVGAWGLLVVLAGAIIIHLAIGSFEVGGLLIYFMAVVVVLVHQNIRKPPNHKHTQNEGTSKIVR